MKKVIIPLCFLLSSVGIADAQTSKVDSSLQFSGSADMYYRYDFAQGKNIGTPEAISLGMKQNSLEFGMLDLKLKKRFGNIVANAELAFGQRETPDASAPPSYNIQNLTATYEVNNKLSFTGGIMYRYQSFERLTSTDNFHYTMSWGFLNQNFIRSAGVKATYAFNEKNKLSLGLYNSNDSKNGGNRTIASPGYGLSDICMQGFFIDPFGAKGLDVRAAIWIEGQKDNGWHRNLHLRYKLAKKWNLGFDMTQLSGADSLVAVRNYNSYVGYLQYSFCKPFSAGIRYEYLDRLETDVISNNVVKEKYSTFTVTSAYKIGNLTLKAEYKTDMTEDKNNNTPYIDKNGIATTKAAEIVMAAVFTF